MILLLYLVLATLHSLVVPLTTGNDEWAHFLYGRFIAEQDRLPATLAEREAAGYKSDAPPLYHLLVGAVTAGVEPVHLLRPLDSPRRYLADNIIDSYALVHTAVEQFPYRGEVLFWHLGRLLSILFGLSLIGLTYLTCRELFPGQPTRAAQAAALVAFTPAILFHSSVLSYESLSASLTALFLWLGIRTLRQPGRRFWWAALGAAAGLALTTKYSAILLPLEIIFIAWLAWRQGGSVDGSMGVWGYEVKEGAEEPGSGEVIYVPRITHHASRFTFHVSRFTFLPLLFFFLSSIWWFGFVLWHFNTIENQGPVAGILLPLLVGDASDTTSVNVAGFLFGQAGEARPPLARDYSQLLRAFLDSFWAAPVAGNFLLSPWLSLLFTGAALLGVAGLWRLWRAAEAPNRLWLGLLLFHTGLILPLLLVRGVFSFDPREVAQGRHVLLPAASAIAILLVWGWAQWSPRLGPLVILGLFLWSALGQLGGAIWLYPPPLSVWPAGAPLPEVANNLPQAITLTDSIRLKAAHWQPRDNFLEVTLWWEALAWATEDYLVELSLADDTGQVIGYSLGHPLQGRYPSRAWEPGDTIQDNYQLPLLPSAPGSYRLSLRLLNRAAQPVAGGEVPSLGELELAGVTALPEGCALWPAPLKRQGLRPDATLMVVSEVEPVLKMNRNPELLAEQKPWHSQGRFHTFIIGPDWPASAQLAAGATDCGRLTFDIPPRNFTVPPLPQPLEANFDNKIELLGYELPTRRIQPGERLPLTLYWRGLAYMGEDYRLFANPLDQEQQRWGGYDRQPRDGYSTLRWVPGEVIVDPFGIPIDPAAPAGIYTLDLGFYRETDSGAETLSLVREGQALEQRSLRLGPIKIGGPPPGVTTDQPEPQVSLNHSLGNQITLLGYTLLAEAETLNLRLFWQAETIPEADYTVFFHLRDNSNQNVAQKDGPPAEGRYPTGLWDPGEVIVDDLSLPLAGIAPGRYQPVVGLYNLATGERLPLSGSTANEIPLEPVDLP